MNKLIYILLFSIPVVAAAQFGGGGFDPGSLFYLNGTTIESVDSTWTLTVPGINSSGAVRCLQITAAGLFETASAGCSGEGADFPLVYSWGNATTTTIGFEGGLITTASSTLINIAKLGIGTSTPDRPFGVQGSAGISGNLYVANFTATGTAEVKGLATGNNGDFDLVVGNTYGGIKLGNVGIYSSSFSASNLNLDKAVLFRQEGNIGVGNDPGIEFAWMEQGNTVRMAIPESGAGNATAMIRSVTIAGPYSATDGNDIVLCSNWGFNKIDCDTGTTGADLGVQDDLQVGDRGYFGGSLYSSTTLFVDQSIFASGTAAISGKFHLYDDISFNNDDVVLNYSTNQLQFQGAANGYIFDAGVRLNTNDAGSLGLGASAWSDLYLASGGVIDWANGDVTLTHASNVLYANGGSFGIATATPSAAFGLQGSALFSGDLILANVTATGTAKISGLATLSSGFLATASSTITGGGLHTTKGIYQGSLIGGSEGVTGVSVNCDLLAGFGACLFGTPASLLYTSIDENGVLSFSGNGGVGATPTGYMDIAGNAYAFRAPLGSPSTNNAGLYFDSTGTYGGSGYEFRTLTGLPAMKIYTGYLSGGTYIRGGLLIQDTNTGSGQNGLSIANNGTGTTTLYASSAKLGVATTTPSNTFSVQGNAAISGNLAYVANITATGTISSIGPNVPSVSSGTCGTSPSVQSGSTDFAGRITTGTGSFTTCTVTFSAARNAIPVCVAIEETTARAMKITPTTTNFVASAAFAASDVFAYICIFKD